MKEQRTMHLFLIAFAAMILLPFPLWALLRGTLDVQLNENRTPAEKPVFSFAEIETYPQAYEAYLNDHLPFRAPMIRAYNTMEYNLLHASLSYMVVYGKDDWLFHFSRTDGDSLSLYRGLRNADEVQLARIRENMIRTRDNLAAKGIEFVIFLTPLKERVYPEYLPGCYGAPAEEYALQQLYEDLRDNTDLRVLYPYAELMAAKETLGEDGLLYYKTDTHWNELGAYVGTVPLLKELGIDVPAYDSGAVSIESAPADKEDLIHLANIEGLIDPGLTYRVTGYDRNGLICTGGDFEAELFFRADGNADPRKVLMKHDSFAEAMEDVFCSQFSETVLVHNRVYEPALVDKYQPDVFIYEVGERNGLAALAEVLYE